MPDQRLRGILTLQLLRSKVPNDATKLPTYNAARRVGAHGPQIYAALVKEAYEQGCLHTACFMERLVAKEDYLLAKMVINERVCANRPLLFTICDMAILVEQKSRIGSDCGARVESLQLLYQLLLTFEQHKDTYNWILMDVYQIVVRVMDTSLADVVELNETKARIYYNYALLLSEKSEERENALKYLEVALQLCQVETWPPDNTADVQLYDTLHAAVAANLSELLFANANDCVDAQPEEALALGQRAISVLVPVGLDKNHLQICTAKLRYVDLLLDIKRYDVALRHLYNCQPSLRNHTQLEFVRLRAKHYLQKGIAYFHREEITRSLQRLRVAHSLCLQYELAEFLIDVLMYLGKAYAKQSHNFGKAIHSFMAARRLCRTRRENDRAKQIDYMLAQLQAGQAFGEFMRLLKSGEYCDHYSLMQWKLLLRPYWLDATPSCGKSNSAIANSAAQQQPALTPPAIKRVSAQAVSCLIDEGYARCMKLPERKAHKADAAKRGNVTHKLIYNN